MGFVKDELDKTMLMRELFGAMECEEKIQSDRGLVGNALCGSSSIPKIKFQCSACTVGTLELSTVTFYKRQSSPIPINPIIISQLLPNQANSVFASPLAG